MCTRSTLSLGAIYRKGILATMSDNARRTDSKRSVTVSAVARLDGGPFPVHSSARASIHSGSRATRGGHSPCPNRRLGWHGKYLSSPFVGQADPSLGLSAWRPDGRVGASRRSSPKWPRPVLRRTPPEVDHHPESQLSRIYGAVCSVA